jgi:hypothetical protein
MRRYDMPSERIDVIEDGQLPQQNLADDVSSLDRIRIDRPCSSAAGRQPLQQILVVEFHALAGYFFQQLTGDSGSGAKLGDFKGRVAGIGPQIGFLFPVGNEHQGYLNLKAYKDFAAENRPEGYTAWVTLAITPAAPEAPSKSPMIHR